MALVGGTWTGDCKEADGTFTEVTYDCIRLSCRINDTAAMKSFSRGDLPTFVALVQDVRRYTSEE